MSGVRCSGITRAGGRCKHVAQGPPRATWFCGQHRPAGPADYEPDAPPTLGPTVVDWIEEHLVHGPGAIQGEPVDLSADPELEAFIWRLYELEPDGRGSWRLRRNRAMLSRPKGRYKSGLLAMIGGVELCEGFRFGGFDADGQPVAVPLRYREVLSVATEEDQAGLTYDVGRYMLANGYAADVYELDIGLTRTNVMDGSMSVWEPITTGDVSKDGGKSTCILEDEGHLYRTPALRRLHQTLTRNLTKNGVGIMVEASTMYAPGENSVAESTHKAYEANPDGRILLDHKQAPMSVDIGDHDQLRAGLEYVYGSAAPWEPIDVIISDEFDVIGVDPEKTEADARRFFLNQPWKGEDKAFDPTRWATLAQPARAWADKPVLVTYDGARTRDCAAICAWTVEDWPHHFKIQVWTRPTPAPADYRHPRGDIKRRAREAVENLDVVLFAYDSSFHEDQSLYDDWIDEWGEADQGGLMVAYPTATGKRMDAAIKRFGNDLAADPPLFTHDGDPEVAAHIANAVLAPNRGGWLTLAKERDSLKIDAAVCAVFGYDLIATARALVEQRTAPVAPMFAGR